VFIGSFHHTLDAKGRVSIPVRFRQVLTDRYEETLIVTTDFDQCLVGYPIDEWRQVEEKIKTLPMMQKEVKDFLRFFYSSAVECPLDRQGRILLPNHLRHYAKLNRDVVLIGMMSKIEVWGERQWKEKEGQVGQNAERISSALTGLGL